MFILPIIIPDSGSGPSASPIKIINWLCIFCNMIAIGFMVCTLFILSNEPSVSIVAGITAVVKHIPFVTVLIGVFTFVPMLAQIGRGERNDDGIVPAAINVITAVIGLILKTIFLF